MYHNCDYGALLGKLMQAGWWGGLRRHAWLADRNMPCLDAASSSGEVSKLLIDLLYDTCDVRCWGNHSARLVGRTRS